METHAARPPSPPQSVTTKPLPPPANQSETKAGPRAKAMHRESAPRPSSRAHSAPWIRTWTFPTGWKCFLWHVAYSGASPDCPRAYVRVPTDRPRLASPSPRLPAARTWRKPRLQLLGAFQGSAPPSATFFKSCPSLANYRGPSGTVSLDGLSRSRPLMLYCTTTLFCCLNAPTCLNTLHGHGVHTPTGIPLCSWMESTCGLRVKERTIYSSLSLIMSVTSSWIWAG